MQEIRDILEPTWGAEKWLVEGWDQLTEEEKSLVRLRMDEMFAHGLPFTLEHDKMSYIRLFSLLAQLEVLAIQVPLKFESLETNPEIRQQMRQQLLDEVFHGLVFTKISFMLSAPYAYPPAYDPAVEELCDFVRNESCSKTALVLLNLIAEGWIETLFSALMTHGVAPKVFSVILADEKRHVDEADLYCAMGLPKPAILHNKILQIETLLLNNLLGNYRYMMVLSGFDLDGFAFVQSLNQKYLQQLEKIDCQPGRRWSIFTTLSESQITHLFSQDKYSDPVELSTTRKLLMSQWKNPQDPTMVGDFELDITSLNHFSYPDSDRHHRINLYMLQTISKMIADKNVLRRYVVQNRQRQAKNAYVSLVTRLPYCDGALSYIVLENCHQLTHQELQARIQFGVEIQLMCFQRKQALVNAHPHLRKKFEGIYYDSLNSVYPLALSDNLTVPISNLGAFGYTGAKSPLLPNDSLKVTLLKVERKPVWNEEKQNFVPRDILPISVSADHRVLDGNIHLPLLATKAFEYVCTKWHRDEKENIAPSEYSLAPFSQYIDYFLEQEVELGYQLLCAFQAIWYDSLLQRFDPSDDALNQLVKSILKQVDPLPFDFLLPA